MHLIRSKQPIHFVAWLSKQMLIQVYNTSKNEMPANDIDSAHDFMKTIGWREALVHFLKWPRSQWRALAQTLIAECSDCRWHSKSANIYKIPFLIPPFSNTTKQTTSLYSVHLGLLQSIVEVTINTPPPTRTLLSKTSQRPFVLSETAELEKMTYPRMQTNCWKGLRVMWRLK